MAAAAGIQANRNTMVGWVWSHAQLGLTKIIQQHNENWIEWTGNKILWTMEDLPGILYRNLIGPRSITVALTTLAQFTNSYIFYPLQTMKYTREFINWIPVPSLAQIRFATYIFTSMMIIGAALRAYGRFSNVELMNNFLAQQPAAPAGDGAAPANPAA